MAHFRFMDLEIWKKSMALNDRLFDLSDSFGEMKSFRVAEQLRAASLSISNNIAEGSGSYSDKDFANFLNIARRSVFETANIVYVAHQRNLLEKEPFENINEELDVLSRKISNFRKSILNKIERKY